MSSVSIKKEMEDIQKALSSFRGGATIEEIKQATELDIELRTLQRRLAEMAKQGIIIKTGHKRSTKWLSAKNGISETNLYENAQNDLIPLTVKSREIISSLSKPLQQRQPIGYNIEFLRSYKPNLDAYLSAADKMKLLQIGNTGKPDFPAGTYAKQILQRFMIDLSWNSSRLEGNTYSLLDTERLISQGKSADDKSAMDAQMILNHKDAIEFLVQSPDNIGFNRYTILNLHAMLSNNLLPDPAASGRLRTIGVGIGKSVFTPLIIPQQIEEMFETILSKTNEIKDPFEQAFFIMVQLPYLQAFDDVNKRVSRLAANIPLIKFNYSPITFIDVPKDLYTLGLLGVYELNNYTLLKDVFVWAYERSASRYASIRQTIGEPDLFRLNYRDKLRSIITQIISNSMGRSEASRLIAEKSREIPSEDQFRFINEVHAELLALHEGNFARYWVTPLEFSKWRTVWDSN